MYYFDLSEYVACNIILNYAQEKIITLYCSDIGANFRANIVARLEVRLYRYFNEYIIIIFIYLHWNESIKQLFCAKEHFRMYCFDLSKA